MFWPPGDYPASTKTTDGLLLRQGMMSESHKDDHEKSQERWELLVEVYHRGSRRLVHAPTMNGSPVAHHTGMFSKLESSVVALASKMSRVQRLQMGSTVK